MQLDVPTILGGMINAAKLWMRDCDRQRGARTLKVILCRVQEDDPCHKLADEEKQVDHEEYSITVVN